MHELCSLTSEEVALFHHLVKVNIVGRNNLVPLSPDENDSVPDLLNNDDLGHEGDSPGHLDDHRGRLGILDRRVTELESDVDELASAYVCCQFYYLFSSKNISRPPSIN